MVMMREIIERDLSLKFPLITIKIVNKIYFFLFSNFVFVDFEVPIVTIVVEGGPDTLLTMYRDLRSQIPIVLIDVRITIVS